MYQRHIVTKKMMIKKATAAIDAKTTTIKAYKPSSGEILVKT